MVVDKNGLVGFSGWGNFYYPASVNANTSYVTVIIANNALSSNNLTIYNDSNTPSIGSSSSPSALDI